MPTRPRVFALLSIVGALLAASICQAQEPETITIGGVKILLPAPAGFKASQAARTVFGPTVLPEGRLISAYASPEDTVKLEQRQPILIPRYMMVQTPRFAEAVEMTPELFGQFAQMVSENHQQLAAADQAFVSELAARLSQASGTAVSLGLGKPLSLGIFFRRPDAFGWALVAPVKLTVADQTVSADVASAVAAVHIGTKVVMTYVYAVLHDAHDLDWVKSTTTAWVNAIRAANPTTPPKAPAEPSPFEAPSLVHVHDADRGFTPPVLPEKPPFQPTRKSFQNLTASHGIALDHQ